MADTCDALTVQFLNTQCDDLKGYGTSMIQEKDFYCDNVLMEVSKGLKSGHLYLLTNETANMSIESQTVQVPKQTLNKMLQQQAQTMR